jgi:hypothetical protein
VNDSISSAGLDAPTPRAFSQQTYVCRDMSTMFTKRLKVSFAAA